MAHTGHSPVLLPCPLAGAKRTFDRRRHQQFESRPVGSQTARELFSRADPTMTERQRPRAVRGLVRPHRAKSPKQASFCRVHQPRADMASAIGKPSMRCKHQTTTVGSNPMLSAIKSANLFSGALAREKRGRFPGKFARKTTTMRRTIRQPFRSNPAPFCALSPSHDGRVVVSDARR